LEQRCEALEAIVNRIPKNADGDPLLPDTEHWIEGAKGKWELTHIAAVAGSGSVLIDCGTYWFAGGKLRSHDPTPPAPKPAPALDAEGKPILFLETYTLKRADGSVRKVQVIGFCRATAIAQIAYLDGDYPCENVPANSLYRGWGPTLRELRETLSAKWVAAGLGKLTQERLASIIQLDHVSYGKLEAGDIPQQWLWPLWPLVGLYGIGWAEAQRAVERTIFKLERTTDGT